MPSISPFPHLAPFFFPSLYIPLSATTKKKITLLAPAGAQAFGSFLNLLHRTTRAFVLLAADEIRNPNPENERKILKTKLSLLTQFAIDNNTLPRSGAHKQDTETRINCNRSMDRSHANRRREKHRVSVISFHPSCLRRQGLREEKGLPGMKQKHTVWCGSMYYTPYIRSLNYIHTE
jgi:hypothetical protein